MYARTFRDASDADCVFPPRVRAGAYLQRDRHIHGRNDRIKNRRDKRFVLQKCRTGRDIADFPGGAAHVDIDDLCAEFDVVSRRIGHRERIRTCNLYRDRIDLPGVVSS